MVSSSLLGELRAMTCGAAMSMAPVESVLTFQAGAFPAVVSRPLPGTARRERLESLTPFTWSGRYTNPAPDRVERYSKGGA